MGYLTAARQREARVRRLPLMPRPQVCADKEGGLVSAKADLPSCVRRISKVRHRCVSGLNSLTIPLSSGGFVLFRLSPTFFKELDTEGVRQPLR